MILQAVIFYSLALGLTTVVALAPRTIRAHAFAGLPLAAAVGALAYWLTTLIFADVAAAQGMAISLAVATVAMRVVQRRWSWVAALLFATLVLASLGYLVYAAVITYAAGLNPLVIVLSTVLLVLEILALALSVSYAFEIVDVLSRRDPPFVRPESTTHPWVALQLATYNEPVDIVQRTLESLARIDYDRLLVQVVDNNTKDPALWQPLQQLCEQLGPRFQFLHLEPWPGYKAGALNEATRRLAPQVEVVGIVDSDYIVQPNFLRAMVGHFDDPTVAFVQSSQNYREWGDSLYLRGLFYSFRYFFDITMPCRSHRNAIIFCGTMGLIRRSAFNEIGGWNQECITEDAEASLRMLRAGYRGVYDATPYGEGLMPLDFDGLKKQRYRWALGGIQILKFHWREMLPLARHRTRLTLSQRLHYLLGSVQWFAEVLTAIFTILLLATAVAASMHQKLPVRQLTGAVLAIPLAFAATGVLRATWAMRRACHTTYRDAFYALRVWFALSWVVTLACIRGLLQRHAEFLRTPKSKEGGSLLSALRASRAETLLTVAAILAAGAMLVRSPGLATTVLGVLLIFEAFVYSNAPWASMAAEGIILTPERQAYALSPQNTGDRPTARRRALAIPVGMTALVGAAAVAALVVSSPSDRAPFSGPQQDLPRIGSVAPNFGVGPTPGPTIAPSPTAAPTAAATAQPGTSPAATPSPTPASTPTATPASTPTATAAPGTPTPTP